MKNICIKGKLVNGPTISSGADTRECTFVISGKERFNEESEGHYFKCHATGKIADLVLQYMRSDTELYISGKYETRSFSDDNNNWIIDNRINVESFFNSRQIRF